MPDKDTDPNQKYKYCYKCGNKLFDEAEICPKCGVRQPSTTPTIAPKYNKLTTSLFAIILGGVGAHKFYLGKTGDGIVYLLFFWTGIPMIAGLIEGLVMLSMSEDEFNAKYNTPQSEKEPKPKQKTSKLSIAVLLFVFIIFAIMLLAIA